MSWVDVDDLKKHLNKTSNVDNDELAGFVDAACSAIEDIMGHVDLVTVIGGGAARSYRATDQRHFFDGLTRGGRRWMVDLTETPVLDVLTVARVASGSSVAIPANDPSTSVVGWALTDTVLDVPLPGVYAVTYRAGFDAPRLPANYRLAALELAGHLWRGSQLNQNSGRPPTNGDQMMVLPHIASAMPYRVRELLGIYGNVVNEHVVIA